MERSTEVATAAGMVSGLDRDGILIYRGVPYGAPTGGGRRFLPPQPAEPWSGVRACLRYGLPAPQPVGATTIPDDMQRVMGAGNPMPMGEDCLVLNVWTPALDDRRRPVMVWLHGGGFTIGSGANPVTSGERLARRGDVVVVTVNHRLGALGFLSLAGFADAGLASSGMSGMLDIQAALEWVQANIAAFGGDPSNVTIFGESGGGMKVSTLLAMPAARGLFHRAIVQSGPGLRASTPEQAAAATAALMDEVQAKTVDDLRALPFERIVEAQVAIGGAAFGATGHGFGPVVDGVALPRHPYDPDAAPTAAGVPLLIGTNRDEMTLFLMPRPGFETIDEVGARRTCASVGPDADRLYDRYRSLHPDATPAELAVAVTSDRFRIGSLQQAERHLALGTPCYVYLMTWESPMDHGRIKAGHSVEVSLVFDNLRRDPSAQADEKAQLVADAMSEAWLAFARSGDPNHAGLPSWPVYDAATRPTMIFDHTSKVDDPLGAERAAWEGLTLAPGL